MEEKRVAQERTGVVENGVNADWKPSVEGQDPSGYQREGHHQRRPQSAEEYRQRQWGNRGQGTSNSWQHRVSTEGSKRRQGPRDGYMGPRRGSKNSYVKGRRECNYSERVHRDSGDQNDKGKEMFKEKDIATEQEASHSGNALETTTTGTSETAQSSDKENVQVSGTVQGNEPTSSADAVSSIESRDFSYRMKHSIVEDSRKEKSRSEGGKQKGKVERLKGQSRGGFRGKNSSQHRRGQFVAIGGNRNTNKLNLNQATESNNGQHVINFDESSQFADAVSNNTDSRTMYQPVQSNYDYGSYGSKFNATQQRRYPRGYRGEHGVYVPERAKSNRPGNRRGFRYQDQQESVVRALSYLNPVQSSQASALIEQLRNEMYECMICCERIRCTASVWSCQNCYHVFHLGCVRKWARSPAASVEGDIVGWRCPACQNITDEVPNIYKCFCGKMIDPEWRRSEGLTPHSCGELCRKQRDSSQCPHHCNQLCHPGPCPSCPVMVTKACPCGKTINRVRCGQGAVVVCKLECNKVLNCFNHRCKRICHTGPCGDCTIKVEQTCYCGKQQREALCGTGEPEFENLRGKSGYFSCQEKCLRVLDCGNHYCQETCHRSLCQMCLLQPQLITHCPCGKTCLADLLGEDNRRKSCLDPVPTCPQICDKILPCRPLRDVSGGHRCKQFCHVGECGPCDGMTTVKCRCGTNTKEIPCIERNLQEYTCGQRCNKKKQCGRHRCNQKCCMGTEHRCELICGKRLRCGYHKCQELCHPGYCPRCLMSSFDELTCHCGATVLYPPIPCGTPPPDCDRLCSRVHPCSHPVNHTCHHEEACPPCTVFTKKKCMGEHEVRNNIPCHVTDISCGKVCGKSLPCGHRCTKICHKPPCLGENESCLHPCERPRRECGHPCGSQCHPDKECPSVPCKVKVPVSCKCGRRSENFPCLQGGEKMAVAQAFRRLTTEALADKMKDLQCGHSVDASSIMSVDSKKPRHLECNDDCAIYERNRRLAEALNIENPDLSQTTSVRYSPFLLAEAKQNLSFIKSVEDALENLVQTARKVSSGQRTHTFPPMNSNQRRLIHELAVFYKCTSRSYDQEPKRNTVVTATKDSFLPYVKLSSQIEREVNPPPPQPIPFLPSQTDFPLKPPQRGVQKSKTWAQVPDYFADDFDD